MKLKCCEKDNKQDKYYNIIGKKNQAYGDALSLSYVRKEENWEEQRLFNDYVASYTINFSCPKLSEIGDIIVGRFENSGGLIRIG